MKTLQLTTAPSQGIADQLDLIQQGLLAKHPKLPIETQHAALFDHLIKTGILGYTNRREPLDAKDVGYGFYENSEDRAISKSDPVGTTSVRIDYDPNWTDPEIEAPTDPVDLFGNLLMALEHPFSYEMNPSDTWIDHFRISAIVAPGVIMTRTIWPVFEPDLPSRSKLEARPEA